MKKQIDIINTTNEPNILQKMGWGGAREGSGAKPKYNEQTKTVAFRCPMSKVDELKLVVKSKLSEWAVNAKGQVESLPHTKQKLSRYGSVKNG